MEDKEIWQTIVRGIRASLNAERAPMFELLKCAGAGRWDVPAFDHALFEVAKQRQETDTMIDQLLDAVEAAREAEAVGETETNQRKLDI